MLSGKGNRDPRYTDAELVLMRAMEPKIVPAVGKRHHGRRAPDREPQARGAQVARAPSAGQNRIRPQDVRSRCGIDFASENPNRKPQYHAAVSYYETLKREIAEHESREGGGLTTQQGKLTPLNSR
jgi:hypothetical protein